MTQERYDKYKEEDEKNSKMHVEKLTEFKTENTVLIEENKKTNLKQKEIEKELADLRKLQQSQIVSYHKLNIIYNSKVRDYAKELEFWKTVISRELFKDKEIEPKELYKTITETLKTYGTLDQSLYHLNQAEYISKILNDDTKKLKKKKTSTD